MSQQFSLSRFISHDELERFLDRWVLDRFHDMDLRPSLYVRTDGTLEIELYHRNSANMSDDIDRIVTSVFDVFGKPDDFDLADGIARLHNGGVLTIPDITATPLLMSAVMSQTNRVMVLTADLEDGSSKKPGVLLLVE